jgi:ubiquinone/menaquinone biosynthesis C-methylase UbiE
MTETAENSIASEGANAPFDTIASTYDDVFSETPIGLAQRNAVWKEMGRSFHPGARILEINCGTGIDAIHMARHGVLVEACDSSPRMIARAQDRADAEHLPVQFRCLSIERIGELAPPATYDGVLSNFSGLNCVSDLHLVATSLARLVKPGGRVILCVFGTFCVWEILWYLSARDLRKAFRRFRRRGVEAVLAPSATVTVHYRTVGTLRKIFAPHFRLERWQGVGILVPPSYAARLASSFPRVLRVAARIDPLIGCWPLARSIGDHTLLTFKRVREVL